MTEERAEFEKFMKYQYPSCSLKSMDGEYFNGTTEHCWFSWQASRKQFFEQSDIETRVYIDNIYKPPRLRLAIGNQSWTIGIDYEHESGRMEWHRDTLIAAITKLHVLKRQPMTDEQISKEFVHFSESTNSIKEDK